MTKRITRATRLPGGSLSFEVWLDTTRAIAGKPDPLYLARYEFPRWEPALQTWQEYQDDCLAQAQLAASQDPRTFPIVDQQVAVTALEGLEF